MTIERPGSFLLPEHEFDESIRVMPTDPMTGLPYPILPVNLPPKVDRDCQTNYHHHFYFRTDRDLESDLRPNGFMVRTPEDIPLEFISGLAVRMSRGQILAVGTHDEAHKRFRAGPEPPRNQADKFRIAALASASVTSQFALDFTRSPGQELVRMKRDEMEYFFESGSLIAEKHHIDRPAQHRKAVIGSFFLRYAAAQNLTHITNKVVDEFLNTTDARRRIELGGLILSQAVDQSIEPILPIYASLNTLGIVPPARPSLRESVKKLIRVRPVSQIVKELTTSLDDFGVAA